MYQYQCEKCGARLDPGEHCDCEREVKREVEHRESFYKKEAGKKHKSVDYYRVSICYREF